MKYTFLIIAGFFFFPAYIHAQFQFQDVTEQSGIYMLGSGSADAGSGVVVFDLNGDGWDDLYLPGGLDSDKIFINMHDGTFMPITPPNFSTHQHLNGQPWRSNPRGGIVFDYDNDGLPDIYSACENDDILWHNNGNFTFADATDSAHLNKSIDQNESMSATFGDFNGDGWNDFYVARSLHQCTAGADPSSDSSSVCTGFPKWLYVNNHDGTFTERAKELGVDMGDSATTNIVVFFDYDRDGDLDLLIGNDNGERMTPNRIYKNMLMETGTATFTDVTEETGLGCHVSCMGIGISDYNRDGKFDFYVTTFAADSFMRNNGTGNFTNVRKTILPPREGFERHGPYITISWTALMGDYDNDGWEDAFVVHGILGSHLLLQARNVVTDPTRRDTSVFYHNYRGIFEDVTDGAMNGEYIDLKARGAAYFDYNHDGKLDIVVGSLLDDPSIITSTFRLLKNISTPSSDNAAHWLEMRFIAKRTAKEAIGTIIDVWSGGVVHTRQVSTGGGFGSQNSLMQHVGLGNDAVADSIIVFWPCDKNRHRQIDRYYNINADTMLTFTEQMTDHASAQESAPKNPVMLYPLPARDILTVSNLGAGVMSHIAIYDLLGIKHIEATTSENTYQIPVSTLSPGSYLMSITTEGIIQNQMFIKE